MRRLQFASTLLVLCLVAPSFAAEPFDQSIRPLLRDYCVTCHSTEKQEGELDLQRFTSIEQIKRQPDVWEHVQEQLALAEKADRAALVQQHQALFDQLLPHLPKRLEYGTRHEACPHTLHCSAARVRAHNARRRC